MLNVMHKVLGAMAVLEMKTRLALAWEDMVAMIKSVWMYLKHNMREKQSFGQPLAI